VHISSLYQLGKRRSICTCEVIQINQSNIAHYLIPSRTTFMHSRALLLRHFNTGFSPSIFTPILKHFSLYSLSLSLHLLLFHFHSTPFTKSIFYFSIFTESTNVTPILMHPLPPLPSLSLALSLSSLSLSLLFHPFTLHHLHMYWPFPSSFVIFTQLTPLSLSLFFSTLSHYTIYNMY
jgi:hypothetical protein